MTVKFIVLVITLASYCCFGQTSSRIERADQNKQLTSWKSSGYDYWFVDTKCANAKTTKDEAILFSSVTELGVLSLTSSGFTLTKPRVLSPSENEAIYEYKESIERGEKTQKPDLPEPHTYKYCFLNTNPSMSIQGINECSHYSVLNNLDSTNKCNLEAKVLKLRKRSLNPSLSFD
jgi:hypothetical protein